MRRGRRALTAHKTRRRELERLIDNLIDRHRFKSRRDVARVCGMSDQGLSAVLLDPRRRLPVEACLRLARAIAMPPVTLLRLADRPEDAQILDDLWPRRRDGMVVTQPERELLDLWRDMTIESQEHIRGLASVCAEQTRARTGGPRGVLRGAKPAFPQLQKRAAR